MNPYAQDLDRNHANYAPLTPVSFLARTAYIWPERTAVIHGTRRYTWRETYDRSRRLASALVKRGIGVGDTVAAVLSNTPEMIEAHFGVPMSGGVLNTLNTRLDADAIAFMLDHGEAKVLLTDTEFAPVVKAALARAQRKLVVIDVADALGPGGEEAEGRVGLQLGLVRPAHDRVLPEVVGGGDAVAAAPVGQGGEVGQHGAEVGHGDGPVGVRQMDHELHGRPPRQGAGTVFVKILPRPP